LESLTPSPLAAVACYHSIIQIFWFDLCRTLASADQNSTYNNQKSYVPIVYICKVVLIYIYTSLSIVTHFRPFVRFLSPREWAWAQWTKSQGEKAQQ